MTRTILAALLLLAALYVGARPVGPVPAAGPFLDPVRGFWSVAAAAELPASASARIPNLAGPVAVRYDDRGVPHVFAETVLDAIRALGYVVARDRLFQLEIQTRATAGTLSELVGPDALEADRFARSIGLAWSAERSWASGTAGSEGRLLLEAYADGVNAWIDGMSPRDLPVEYHLLGARPQRWRPQHGLYLLKRMGLTLAYSTIERRKEAVAALVGWNAADALFPAESPIQEPIQVNGALRARVDVETLPPPGGVDEKAERHAAALDVALRSEAQPCDRCLVDDVVVGSNNWAAGTAKTANGHALLAGDPHLSLTLPSIWYEVHLSVPGTLDAYGVAIPGMPGIAIGFNRDVAWSFTNTGADVLDLYVEEVDDPTSPRSYRLDGDWEPLDVRVEVYRDRRGRVLATDTLYHSHRGPLLRGGPGDSGAAPSWLSMRWTLLEADAGVSSFHGMLTASDVGTWLAAFADFDAPAQNGVVADRHGSIAIRSTGKFPVRPGQGRGDRLQDGTSSASDWTGYWPVDRYPFSRDPAQGFVASANQQPVDPRENDSYLGADWPAPWRAIRINELLRAPGSVDSDDFRRFQTDPGSARVEAFLPEFLAAARRLHDAGHGDEALDRAAALLAEWDRRYTPENTRAVLFEAVMTELSRRVWDELDRATVEGPRRVATPGSEILAVLLRDPGSVWWDDHATADVVETRDDILAASLRAALRTTRERHGDEDGGGWRWSGIRHANIHHLLRIPALSALGLPVQGGPSTVSPSSGDGTHGASWRMVVELGDEVEARVVYPGGQSGNPVSSRYRDRIATWTAGELDPVRFPRGPDELGDRVASVLTLNPEP